MNYEHIIIVRKTIGKQKRLQNTVKQEIFHEFVGEAISRISG